MSAGWFRRRFLPGGLLSAPGPSRPRASPVPYRRPRFLRGSGSGPGPADASRRPDARPVRSPARGRALPWNAGYAEIINAEKSEFNEDQASCGKLCIRRCEFGAEEDQEWLTLCPEEDEVIGRELEASGQVGGCTALVAVSLQGKLYVANAGDSRAILVRRDEVRPLSSEFTPETERQRIQQLAFVYPELLAGEFTRLEFPRRLKGDDLGQKVLFRDHHMSGWGYKCVEKSDLKYPLIHGQGRQVSEWPLPRIPLKLPPTESKAPKGCSLPLCALLVHLLGLSAVSSHLPCPQARLLGTLAVSRGLGDHQLRVLDTDIQLKPFLLSVPQVTVLDVDQLELQEEDVVVMATDGLWDVLSNEQVARLVRSFLPGNREDPHRFSELAKMLIHSTQGKDGSPTGEGQVSYDDVSVFVIPLHSHGQGSSGH
nr:protein phosphatase 1M isoform X7 [Equus caballus]